MKKLLTILVISITLNAQSTNDWASREEMLKDIALLYPYAMQWVAFTLYFKNNFFVETKIIKNKNPFLIDYRIYSKENKKLIYKDELEVKTRSRKKIIGNSILYGAACLAIGFMSGYAVARKKSRG